MTAVVGRRKESMQAEYVGAEVSMVAPPCARALRVEVGKLEEIPIGQGRAFVIDGRTIAVFRLRDGRLFASDNECPHRGGPLAEGVVGNGRVICPLHGWKVDLTTGRCLGESATVRVHGVEVVGGRIVVTVAQ